jgi:peptidoglycan/LPS O-acetylase OafA/YrhL
LLIAASFDRVSAEEYRRQDRNNIDHFQFANPAWLAALGVVFYYTDFRLPGDWSTDFFGVSTFFVISGFIMCFISRDDVGAERFLMKRAIRNRSALFGSAP